VGDGSGSRLISSGRRAINKTAGIIPVAMVNNPRSVQALRHPQPVINCWATYGIRAKPVPCVTPRSAKAKDRRRMNQLLMAVEVANSSGLAKTIRPGTYSV
jgi:hypothetical protein